VLTLPSAMDIIPSVGSERPHLVHHRRGSRTGCRSRSCTRCPLPGVAA
jgi:hypothetical protein